MCRNEWELASWIATTIGFIFTIIGLIVVIIQLQMQRRQSRLDALSSLYKEFDTKEARFAREYIYNAPSEHLRLEKLHSTGFKEQRKLVEETLAMLERMAYPIVQKQIPSDDAFNLYGGVLLSITKKLWPYVEDQRKLRAQSIETHRLLYRRYLEEIVHEWASVYAQAVGLPEPARRLPTKDLFNHLFSSQLGGAKNK
jgi:hypothetical protein